MLLDYLTVCYFKLSLKLKTDMKTCILSKTNKSFKLNLRLIDKHLVMENLFLQRKTLFKILNGLT